MVTIYSAVAVRPEEIVNCTALNAEDFTERYAEKVNVITESVKDDSLREKVKQTLGCFEKGGAGNLVQSSPYRLVVLQQLLPQGKRLATMTRLRIAKENDPNFMSGFYVDGGLNLAPYVNANEAVNAFQAGELKADLKSVRVDLTDAKLIPYHLLISQVNGKSPSGLVFKLSEEGKDTARNVILNTNDFKWNYNPAQGGLFGACLSDGGFWGCDYGALEYSDGVGGVVVESSAEGTSQKNLDSYLTKIKEDSERQIKEIAERARKAGNYLKTGRLE